MFGMAILSHGLDDGYVYAFDGTIQINEFVNQFKPSDCPGLFQKPKLFFIQACRGFEFDHGVVVPRLGSNTSDDTFSEYNSWPLDADILIHFAQSAGCTAFGDKQTGSWFINSLVSFFEI